MALTISGDIDSLIEYLQALPSPSRPHSDIVIKHTFDSLSASERDAFLKWGGFTIGPRLESGRQTVLDENQQPFSKKGLKRVIRRYFDCHKRPERRRLARKRKREIKELNESNKSDNKPRYVKYRKIRGKKLRDHVQQKLKEHPNSPHIVLDCRFDHLMTHQVLHAISKCFCC